MDSKTRRFRDACVPVPVPASRRPLAWAGMLLAACLAWGTSLPARAASGQVADPGQGALLGQDADGTTVDFPLKHTDVRIEVSGFLARARVTQHFTNPYDRRIEAVYVFPLPENAAVDDMTLQVGDRTIRGVVRERGEARRVYDQARASGRTAALLEQERPNIFTQSVANLLPGDDVRITIEYVQTIRYEAGTLSLSFPMVVGPRYVPGHATTPEGDAFPQGPRAAAVPDADRITPPVLRPGTRSGHDIALSLRLDAGVPFTDLRSKTHRIEVARTAPGVADVRLADDDAIPDRDFELAWDVRPERVAAGLLAHRGQADGFLTLMLVPPPSPRAADVTPREMVFVLDCSGSMSGAPIEAAKALVRHALGGMNPGDTFRILSFSMSASGLAPEALPNTPANVARGLRYLDGLRGEGGTEMIAGIRAALGGSRDPRRMRVVMFLTDGYIGNETEILADVRARIGDARLYALGVGGSVNRYLLEELAREGRGEVQYILPHEDATPIVARFYDRIRSPVLTDIAIDWGGLDVVQQHPERPRDLFAGHPLLVTAKYRAEGQATVRVTGLAAGERVSIPVKVSLPDREPANAALASLWARQAIEERMRRMIRGEDDRTVREIIDLSVVHRVLSRYTAFVAVEEQVRTDERGAPVRVEVPVEMPRDVSFEGVFGGDEAEVAGAAPAAYAAKSVGVRRREVVARAPAREARMDGAAFAGGGLGFVGTGAGRGGGGAGFGGTADATARPEPSPDRDTAVAAQTVATRAPEATAPDVRIEAAKGIGDAALRALAARVRVALAQAGAGLSGVRATLRVVTEGKGTPRVVAIAGLDGDPAARERVRRALADAGLWLATAPAAPAGTAVLSVQF